MTETNRTYDTTSSALCPPDSGPIAQPGADLQSALGRADIAARCVSAPTASERRRWQVIALLADQVPLAEIVTATGYRLRTIREIAQRYHASGAAALADRRSYSQGAPPLLTPALQRELQHALQRPPLSGGEWNGPMVAHWIADRTGKRVHRQRGWEYLRRLAGTPVPDDQSQPHRDCATERTERTE